MYTTDKKQLEGTWQSASQYIHVVCQFYPGSLEHMMQGGVNTHSLHHAALFLTSLQSPMQQILYVHLKKKETQKETREKNPRVACMTLCCPRGRIYTVLQATKRVLIVHNLICTCPVQDFYLFIFLNFFTFTN